MRPGVCYVGLAYKRRDPTGDDRFAVCAAQMFLSSGEGVVFRGALGPWYRADSEQFHLDELAARNLVKMVIDEYRGQHNNEPPAELFVHAKSSFTDEEWKGFTSGAPPLTNVVGVQIADGKDNPGFRSNSISRSRALHACQKRFPDETKFWVDYGVGKKFCGWIEGIISAKGSKALDDTSVRAPVEEIVSNLIRLGVVQAANLENALSR